MIGPNAPASQSNLNVPRISCVNSCVSPLRLLLCLLPLSLFSATPDLAPMLRAVEARYNHAQTLQVVIS